MSKSHKHIILNLVTAVAVTLFFSCGNSSEDLQKFTQRTDGPSAEGEGVLLKYTDSGKVVATLKTPLLIDYGLLNFPYQEFPNGVEVTFIDDDQKENYITADYAIRYTRTSLIDMRKNVVLITSDSTRLDASGIKKISGSSQINLILSNFLIILLMEEIYLIAVRTSKILYL